MPRALIFLLVLIPIAAIAVILYHLTSVSSRSQLYYDSFDLSGDASSAFEDTWGVDYRRVYKDKVTGLAKYANGVCRQDSHCFPAGCSKEFCSSDKNLKTTCAERSDFPSTDYSCGCVDGTCSWYSTEQLD